MAENKIYAVKKNNELWAAIDCGPTRTGGMTTGTFWLTHFKKDGRTFRWHDKIFNPPAGLQEWEEIQVMSQQVTVVTDQGEIFEGWEDAENLAFKSLANFASLIGRSMTIEEVKEIITNHKSSNS